MVAGLLYMYYGTGCFFGGFPTPAVGSLMLIRNHRFHTFCASGFSLPQLNCGEAYYLHLSCAHVDKVYWHAVASCQVVTALWPIWLLIMVFSSIVCLVLLAVVSACLPYVIVQWWPLLGALLYKLILFTYIPHKAGLSLCGLGSMRPLFVLLWYV